MTKFFFALMLVASSFAATAQESEQWTRIGTSSDSFFDAQKGSGHFSKTAAGDMIYVIRARFVANGSTTYEQEYVRTADCIAGFGRTVSTDMTGAVISTTNFNLQGTTVGDNVARSVCAAARFHAAADAKDAIAP